MPKKWSVALRPNGTDGGSDLYLERGTTHNLARGARKSPERQLALLYRANLSSTMKIIESPKPFPLRTLMVCFTIWLIATEILVFDQVRFNANAELLQQAARALRGPEVIVPTERPAHSTSDARMQNL